MPLTEAGRVAIYEVCLASVARKTDGSQCTFCGPQGTPPRIMLIPIDYDGFPVLLRRDFGDAWYTDTGDPAPVGLVMMAGYVITWRRLWGKIRLRS
jgi:hypothetical protein